MDEERIIKWIKFESDMTKIFTGLMFLSVGATIFIATVYILIAIGLGFFWEMLITFLLAFIIVSIFLIYFSYKYLKLGNKVKEKLEDES